MDVWTDGRMEDRLREREREIERERESGIEEMGTNVSSRLVAGDYYLYFVKIWSHCHLN